MTKTNALQVIYVGTGLMLFILGCRTSTMIYSSDGRPLTAIMAEIDDVQLEGYLDVSNMKPWRVSMTVTEILSGPSDDVVMKDESVSVYVHSPALTFGMGADEMKGKKFKIIFMEEFSNVYDGEIRIGGIYNVHIQI